MCIVCGKVYCDTRCPEYDAREDPSYTGDCELCGTPLYRDDIRYCEDCREVLEAMENEDKDIISFDAEKHEYIVNGNVVPCVSDIIAVYGKEIEEGDDLENTMEAAAERGTVCHKVLEMLLGGREPEYPSAYEMYVDAIRLFLSEHTILPLAIETPIYSEKYGYAGTPDLLCYFDGVLSLLDYKFVAQILKTKVKAQLNAYCKAYEEQDVYPDQLLAIQFLKDGTYRVYPVKYDDEEIEVAVKLWNLKQKKHPRGKIA